jgi:hypothetical protein
MGSWVWLCPKAKMSKRCGRGGDGGVHDTFNCHTPAPPPRASKPHKRIFPSKEINAPQSLRLLVLILRYVRSALIHPFCCLDDSLFRQIGGGGIRSIECRALVVHPSRLATRWGDSEGWEGRREDM